MSCVLWHEPNNLQHPTGDTLRDVCAPCRRLQADVDQLVKKARRTSEATVAARASIGSNYPLKYLSPTSKADRVSRISKERKNLSANVSALSPFNFDLKDKQHSELLQFVHTIQKDSLQNSRGSLCEG